MMNFTEKDYLQAKHRLEEAQARNRVKERALGKCHWNSWRAIYAV